MDPVGTTRGPCGDGGAVGVGQRCNSGGRTNERTKDNWFSKGLKVMIREKNIDLGLYFFKFGSLLGLYFAKIWVSIGSLFFACRSLFIIGSTGYVRL